MRQPFSHGSEARQVLADAENDLQMWQPNLEPVNVNSAGLGSNLMPSEDVATGQGSSVADTTEHEAASPETPQHQHHNVPEGSHLKEATHA